MVIAHLLDPLCQIKKSSGHALRSNLDEPFVHP